MKGLDKKLEEELQKCMEHIKKGPVSKMEREIVYERLFQIFRELKIQL
ncbi:hypothetical protein BSNK01_23180 [Bacillaceae bacterium]